jgi:hypothetical protein
MSIIEDRGISKDYSKWWAKQGEEPQDLLLVRQAIRDSTVLLNLGATSLNLWRECM